MALIRQNSRHRRFLRITLIIGIVLALGIFGLHLWFVANARNVLKQIVHERSKGKLKLELSKFSFSFLSNKIQIDEADLASTDSTSDPVTYHVKFQKLTLHVASLWPLLQKKILLDSIKLYDPEIEVFQWRKDTLSKFAADELSLPQEMSKLYNSMLGVLDTFGIKRIAINNAKVSLFNKIKPGSEPVSMSNIYFEMIRRNANVGKRDEFVEDEQTVGLTTTHQNIALPGGRHRLSFKNFNLQLFQQRIELDSCTVTAMATDSSKSSYAIFFKKLSLVGVDFGAMYRYNLIKADSVYCENPLFDIHINTTGVASGKKERPNPEKIIQELTGDLDLAFVGVKDAGIKIEITDGDKKRSLFNSNKDDFEMRGLRIHADPLKPVSVERFDMLVRDYQLYNEDSSAAYTFDSIHFVNNKIVLNNFSASTISSPDKLRNQRDFKIPYFELTELDWYQLIFEKNLKAREAVLINPVINYIKRKPSVARKKTNLFASLQSLDDLLTLDKINIINGEINMKLGAAVSLNLENANLSLQTNRLLQSTNQQGLRKAVDRLSFSNGTIRLKDMTAQLQNVSYTGSNLIHADKIFVTSNVNKIKAAANDVYLDDLLLDDEGENIIVDGIRWKNATVTLKTLPNKKPAAKTSGFHLKNISGNNTQLNFSSGQANITTFIKSIKVSSLQKNGNKPIQAEEVFLSGNDLSVNSGPMKIKAASYQLINNGPSYITQVKMNRSQQGDTLDIQSPRLDFSADMNSILAKDIHISTLQAQSPVIKMIKRDTAITKNKNGTAIRIDEIIANEPVIYMATHHTDSVTIINIPYSEKSLVKASGFKMNGHEMQLGSLSVNTTAATLVKRTGEIVGVEKGKVDLQISNIQVSKKDGKPFWSAVINNLYLQNPNTFTIGKNKNKLLFAQASVGNFNLSSDYLTDFNQLIKFNVSAWLRTATGQYIDSNTTLNWYNAEYNYSNRILSLDSFAYFPTQPRDSVIAKTPYQTDYITFRSGPVNITGFNLEKYEKDSSLLANTINITSPQITIYRDKLPPFLPGIIKPLPVDIIRNIALPVSVQRINIIDGNLSYTEKNPKSRAEGTLFLTHINGGLSNIKNRNLAANDSLLLSINAFVMDSALVNLRVKESYTDSLSGFLMTLRMKPTSLSFLNPVLAPLSNVIITSGTIDSFHLRAIGRDELSFGEMNMYYHNLRIKLIKDGDPDKSTFLTKAASFLANTFVIKKNNNGRTGIAYFERLRDRSFFNYIVKMTFSGMATSIGVVKNRKYMKQYKRELQQRDLPPVDFE